MKEFFNWQSFTTVITTLCVTFSAATVQAGGAEYNNSCVQGCEQPCQAPCETGWFSKIAAVALGAAAGAGVGAAFNDKGKHGRQGHRGPNGPQGNIGPIGAAGAASTVAGPTGVTGATGIGATGAAGPVGPTGELPFGGSLTFTFTLGAVPGGVTSETIDVLVVDPEENQFVFELVSTGTTTHTFTFTTSGLADGLPFFGAWQWGFYIRNITPGETATYTTSPVSVVINLSSSTPGAGDNVTYTGPAGTYTKGDQYVRDIGFDPDAIFNYPNPIPLP